jgi:putative ABC transport system permease protein
MMLFRLLSLPYLRKHFLRWILTVTGIVLGVAVFVAMHTANRSIFAAFDKTVDQIAGATQLQVSAGEFGFDESVLEHVQQLPEVAVAAPVIESTVETNLPGQGSILILGVDLTGDRSLREYEFDDAEEAIIDDPLVFLAQPDSLIVTKEFAVRNGLQLNGRIALLTVEGEKRFTIRGIMKSRGMAQAFSGNLAVMDIYAAQRAFGRGRRFDRIDLRARTGVSVERCQVILRQALGSGFEVEPPSTRGQHFEALLQSYSTAMTISSLYAMIVGMFIIYNSFSIAVTQRRYEIGVLRAVGATRSQIKKLFFLESIVAGIIGSAGGAAFGMVIALAIARRMSSMLQQVTGVTQHVEGLAVDPILIVAGICIGLAASIVSAWIPARNAARVDPIQALQKGRYQVVSSGENFKRRRAALLLFLVSLICLFFSNSKPMFYAGYVLIILAGLLLAPALTLSLSKAFRPFLQRVLRAEGTLAADSLVQAPRRTSATVSALMLSLAMVVGLGGVTHSLYRSFHEWMDNALNPDFFVSPDANLTNRSLTFPPDIVPAIEAVQGVDQVQLVRSARIMYDQRPVLLISVEAEKMRVKVHRVPVAGDADEMERLTAAGKGLIISDGFASLHQVGMGDTVTIPTPSGLLRLRVVGILRDYSDIQGSIFIDRAVYQQWWHDNTINVARVYAKPGENVNDVRQRLVNVLSGGTRLLILTNQEVRDWALDLVNQWFQMTYIQIAVAIVVAVLGIVNTLTVSIMDRRRELAIMRAVGGLRHQIRTTVWLEALTIGMIGLVLGVCLGALNLYYTLGMVRRDLGGLDLDYIFPWSFVVFIVPAILIAAFIAALGPAESAVRGTLVEALEYE